MINRPKIAFMVDVRNWAYDLRATRWKKLLESKFNIDIFYLKDYSPCRYNKRKNVEPILDHKLYDGILFFFHMAHTSSVLKATIIPKSKIAVCINNEKWVLDGSLYTYNTYFRDVKILAGCNSFIIKSFSEYRDILPLTQCVDENVFYPMDNIKSHKSFIVGWSGNSNNLRKNLKWLERACTEAKVQLSTSSNLNQSELNSWYNQINVLVCCSTECQEGGPNCILEAGACKVPVITTPVGLTRDLIEHNHNGIITPHKRLDLLISNIQNLQNNKEFRNSLAENLHEDVLKTWTYDKRLDQIINVLNALVGKTSID